jgi:predicted  nucleic acid-binding Zn-ribbon protein
MELKFRMMEQKVEDPIVLKVMAKYYERSQLGINKYGTTLAREDLELTDWLTHAQDEAMDLSLYIERIKQEIESMKKELKDIKEKIVSSKTQSVIVKYDIK